jgi:hypothetical protein
MSAVWIGFAGVIVGGMITVAWSWLAVIRRELSDAMVAARLVDEDLAAVAQALSTREAGAQIQPDGQVWEQHRGSLARVLGKQQWDDVSTAYRRRDPMSEEPLPDRISAARKALAELVAGKRYIIPQRWRNALHGRGRNRDRPAGPAGPAGGDVTEEHHPG